MSGSGKIAMRAKTTGRSNQMMEFLMDMELRLKQIIMMMNRIMAAIVISI